MFRDINLYNIFIREIKSLNEIESYFELRNSVYIEHGWLDDRPQTLDLDMYDMQSLFLGAFNGEEGELVAGSRMILSQNGPNAQVVQRISNDAGIAISNKTDTYPSQAAFKADWFVKLCSNHNMSLAEFGRMVCRPGFRSHGIGGAMVHAIHGLAILHGIQLGFSSGPKKLTDFYTTHGCKVMETMGDALYPDLNMQVVPLLSDLSFMNTTGFARRAAQALNQGNIVIGRDLCATADQPLAATPLK